MRLFVITIFFEFNIHILLCSDCLSHLHVISEELLKCLSCVLILLPPFFSMFFCTWSANAWSPLHFLSSRLLNFGRSEGFVVTVATQNLVVTSANSALRKILRIQKIVITITSKVPIAHVEGLILIQKLRCKLKWYNAAFVRTGFMRIILVWTLLKRYATYHYLL